MTVSIRPTGPATPRKTLAGVRCHPAQADLHPQVPASPIDARQVPAPLLRAVAADAMRRVMSQKAAALTIALSEGRLSHKLHDGSLTLAQLEPLGPIFFVEFGKQLLATFGTDVQSPRDRARDLIPDLIREILRATA